MGRPVSIDTDYSVLREVLLNERLSGWAVEFGVYSGYSLGLIAEHMPVIGFDSFEGLPEDWREGFPKGAFTPDPWEKAAGPPYQPNAMLVPGWFSDTVPTFRFPQLGLVHIDCDLYSSTVTALEGVVRHIAPGTFIVFDEFHGYDGWEMHEAKAWGEFVEKYKIDCEVVASGEQEMAFRIGDIGVWYED